MKKLLIVESPGKIKTISSILGADWKVVASYGHIRDLPDKDISISPPSFSLSYKLSDRSKKTVSQLKSLVREVDSVYLATDPDREGEAIAWHIADELKLKKPIRVTFNEISEKALKAAIAAPRTIDMDLVHAQEARRALDRIVGYMVSPELWRRLPHKGLSAGRVQSPALRLIVDRDKEISNFVPTAHFGATLTFDGVNGEWRADWDIRPLLNKGQEYWTDENFANRVADIRNVTVISSEDTQRQAAPPPPFITSTLQRAGSVRFRWRPKKTMDIAQKLYEAGLITYMRTDSPNLSEDAIAEVFAWGKANGKAMAATSRHWKAKESAQEAHEAIRPKHFDHQDAGEDNDQKLLYRLIWERAVASQMAAAIFDVRTVSLQSTDQLDNKSIRLIAKGEVLRITGWKSLTGKDETEETKDEEEPNNPVPELRTGSSLVAKNGKVLKKQTRPPQRYTEATLVAELESRGIGRPSTYAATMDTLTTKSYVEIKEEGKGKSKREVLFPTEVGVQVIDMLRQSFSFMEFEFTSKMEEDLDEIAKGRAQYVGVVSKLYALIGQETRKLPPTTQSAGSYNPSKSVSNDPSMPCPECGRPMRRIPRRDKTGFFWGCSGYQEGCKVTLPDNNGKPNIQKVSATPVPSRDTSGDAVECSVCGSAMILRQSGTRKFYGCSTFPKCRNTVNRN